MFNRDLQSNWKLMPLKSHLFVFCDVANIGGESAGSHSGSMTQTTIV